MVTRSAKMTLTIAPLMIFSYFLGLPHGPKGVAFAYSTIMLLWLIPVSVWSVHGTAVSFRDVITTVTHPLAASLAAGVAAYFACAAYGHPQQHLVRLVLGISALLSVYAVTVLYVFDQKSYYFDLFRKLTHRAPVEQEVSIAV